MTLLIFKQSHRQPRVSIHGQGRVLSRGRRCEFYPLFPHFTMAPHDAPPKMAAARSAKEPSHGSNKPLESFRLKGVSAAVFENYTEQDVSYYKVQIVRTYRADDGFKTTNVFSRDELPIVALLAERAWQSILDREATKWKEADAE